MTTELELKNAWITAFNNRIAFRLRSTLAITPTSLAEIQAAEIKPWIEGEEMCWKETDPKSAADEAMSYWDDDE